MPDLMDCHWQTAEGSGGMTAIYAGELAPDGTWSWSHLIGVFESWELANRVVNLHNTDRGEH